MPIEQKITYNGNKVSKGFVFDHSVKDKLATYKKIKRDKKMDFQKSIFEARKAIARPFVAAHRGVSGANIPCNTLAAYQIAVNQGADVVEIDVSKSKDGKYFVFHPGMEPVFIQCGKYLCDMAAEEIRELTLRNSDSAPTHYKIPSLAEALSLLKNKVYINVDKFWTDVPGITEEIRKAGVENQVIVKTPADEKSWDEVEQYAPDLMYMTLAWHKDDVTERLAERNIRLIGIEALFDKETDEIASDGYVRAMHEKGLLVWMNAIIYNEKEVISAGRTDDISLTKGASCGWGWLCSKGADFIQTDWTTELLQFLKSGNKKRLTTRVGK